MRPLHLIALIFTLVLGAAPLAVQAQQTQQAQLPPGLLAAINSGNSGQIQQVILALSGGNPAVAATLANQVAARAEQLLATNPLAAVAAANAALNTVGQQQVQTGAPQQSLSVATIAARIFVNPNAQRVAPQEVAAGAAAAVRVVTNPAVYGASPQAAIGVMNNAYAAVTSPAVSRSVPGGAQNVASLLQQAAQNPTLRAIDSSISTTIQQVLATNGGTRNDNPVVYEPNPQETGTPS